MNRRDRRAAKAQGGWIPLQRASLIPRERDQIAEAMAHIRRVAPNVDVETVRDIVERAGDVISETWKNDRYQVHVIRWGELKMNGQWTPIVQLSIRRNDRAPCRDWRDMQRIKNHCRPGVRGDRALPSRKPPRRYGEPIPSLVRR